MEKSDEGVDGSNGSHVTQRRGSGRTSPRPVTVQEFELSVDVSLGLEEGGEALLGGPDDPSGVPSEEVGENRGLEGRQP